MKTKSKINFIVGGGVILLMFIGINQAGAQTSKPREGTPVEAITVATVNIYDAKAVLQEGNDWKVSFDLSNRTGAQPGVKYGVELEYADSKVLADRVIYPETIFLSENSTIHKEIIYSVPEYLIGKFRIWVTSQNENGLLLGQVVAGETVLIGTGKYVDIGSCALKVVGDNDSFNLRQGVDVSAEEELSLYCMARNLLDTDVTITPHFKTTFRTAFGKTISEEDGQAIQLTKEEQKLLILPIPKAGEPQAYDVEVSFADSAGKKIANPIALHYVLRGASATIQNVTLDKDEYAKGDTVSVYFFWSGRADNFPGARQRANDSEKTFLKIATTKSNGEKCAEVFGKELDSKNPFEKLKVAIENDCQNGKMLVSLSDEGGKILDEKTIEFRKVVEVNAVSASKEKNNLATLLYIFAGLVLLFGLAVMVVKKRKNNGITGVLLLFFLFGLMLGNEAKADTLVIDDLNFRAEFTISLNGSSFCPGDTIVASGSGAVDPTCNNNAGDFYLDATYESSTQELFSGGISNGYNRSGSKSFTVNSYHTVTFTGGVDWEGASGYKTESKGIDFTIVSSGCGGGGGGGGATSCSGGYYCDGSSADGTAAGQWVCANDNQWWQCSSSGSWVGPSGACSCAPVSTGACGCWHNQNIGPPPFNFPAAGGGRYCSPDSSYVAGSFTTHYNGAYEDYWYWTCGSTPCWYSPGPPPASTPSCSALPPAPTPVPGDCNATTVLQYFSSPPTDSIRCSSVNGNINFAENSTTYSWYCSGSNNGTPASCSAKKCVAPNCISADQLSCIPPGNKDYTCVSPEAVCLSGQDCTTQVEPASCFSEDACGLHTEALSSCSSCAAKTKECYCPSKSWKEVAP